MTGEIKTMRNIFTVIFLAGALTMFGVACKNQTAPSGKSEKDQAVEAAQKVFAEMKATGVDMSSGPCLSDEIISDWVADVAHSPRQEVDNLPANQCSSFREGKARHFVELDTEGKFLRAN